DQRLFGELVRQQPLVGKVVIRCVVSGVRHASAPFTTSPKEPRHGGPRSQRARFSPVRNWAASLVPLTRHSDLHANECSPRALSAGCLAPPLLRVVKGATARCTPSTINDNSDSSDSKSGALR